MNFSLPIRYQKTTHSSENHRHRTAYHKYLVSESIRQLQANRQLTLARSSRRRGGKRLEIQKQVCQIPCFFSSARENNGIQGGLCFRSLQIGFWFSIPVFGENVLNVLLSLYVGIQQDFTEFNPTHLWKVFPISPACDYHYSHHLIPLSSVLGGAPGLLDFAVTNSVSGRMFVPQWSTRFESTTQREIFANVASQIRSFHKVNPWRKMEGGENGCPVI